MGYGLEVEMVALANDKGLLTTPYVFSSGRGRRHGQGRSRYHRLPHGPHDRRPIGAETALKLADCPALVDGWAEAALSGESRRPLFSSMAARWPSPQDADFIMTERGIATASTAPPRWSPARWKPRSAIRRVLSRRSAARAAQTTTRQGQPAVQAPPGQWRRMGENVT